MNAMEKLVYCQSSRPSAKFNLFCFPWLGGGSLFYAKWWQILPESIEVNSIRLPGRESRYKDDLYIDIEVAKYDICNTLLPKLKEKPFLFFGHSLGALVSYAVATHLKEHHNMEPQHLIVSGTSCPQSPTRKESGVKWSTLTDDEFIDHLSKLGGTPPEVLAHRDLMKMSMEACKRDSHLLENYEKYVPLSAILTCPISFFDGDKDKKHDYEGWGDLTKGSFSSQILPGGHFYLHEDINSRKIAGHIIQANITS
ncbi:S-acyl fatty acid synthase thioesterase, medium chain-like [Amphiura filiformis]|uniref:S-acyl fatty acid synthase thioesterase, medium chain-like n=1 Tax=Amphiura filiformis TaxID=82378 RepID=UPI003B2139FA